MPCRYLLEITLLSIFRIGDWTDAAWLTVGVWFVRTVPTDGVAKSGFDIVVFNMILLLRINSSFTITSFSLPSNNSGSTLYFGISGSSLIGPYRFGATASSLIWYAFEYSV